jgi:hypothetical protein
LVMLMFFLCKPQLYFFGDIPRALGR